MFLDFYDLPEQPFGVTPDPRFLYLNDAHKEALTSVLHGIEARRGIMVLVAEPGLGKTTLLYRVLNQLKDQACTVFLFQITTNRADLLRAILAALGVVDVGDSLLEMQLRLKECLVEQARAGRRFVIAIDEAQSLSDSSLELLRSLSNFETQREKLIQIVLCGQPALVQRLRSPELVALRQRIAVRAYLRRLTPAETWLYVESRLATAGVSSSRAPLFTQEAMALLAEFSQGVPRLINNLCFAALERGFALKRGSISGAIVREAAAELDLVSPQDEAMDAARVEAVPTRARAEVVAAQEASGPAHKVARLAAVAAILLVVCGSLYEGLAHWGPWAPAKVSTVSVPSPAVNPGVPSKAAAAPANSAPAPEAFPPLHNSSSGAAGAAATPDASVKAVKVGRGQTLLGICSARYGNCDSRLLLWIRALNPHLGNLDHLEPGETVWLPVLGTMPKVASKGH